MDVASDRVKHIQSSRLRLLKEMQERRVLGELSKTEAQRHMANLATQNAFRELAKAQQHCSTAEAALYQELMTFDDLSSASLDRHNLHIERLAAEITRSREMLDNARIAEEQADAAASETRKLWVACSAATRKWRKIEDDVLRTLEIHSEVGGEMETDDEILVRFGRSSPSQVAKADWSTRRSSK